MTPFLVEASPLVHADAGRAALQRGPVVYCLEGIGQTDNPYHLMLSSELHAQVETTEGMPFPIIRTDGWRRTQPHGDELYFPLASPPEHCRLTFIPMPPSLTMAKPICLSLSLCVDKHADSPYTLLHTTN